MRKDTSVIFRQPLSTIWPIVAMLTAATAGAAISRWSGDEPMPPGAVRLEAILGCKQALNDRVVATFDNEVATPDGNGGEAVVVGRMLKNEQGRPKPFYYRCRYSLPDKTVTGLNTRPALATGTGR